MVNLRWKYERFSQFIVRPHVAWQRPSKIELFSVPLYITRNHTFCSLSLSPEKLHGHLSLGHSDPSSTPSSAAKCNVQTTHILPTACFPKSISMLLFAYFDAGMILIVRLKAFLVLLFLLCSLPPLFLV